MLSAETVDLENPLFGVQIDTWWCNCKCAYALNIH